MQALPGSALKVIETDIQSNMPLSAIVKTGLLVFS